MSNSPTTPQVRPQAAPPAQPATALLRWIGKLPRSLTLRGLAGPAAEVAFDAADFNPALRTRLFILQPTPFCNIDCDYCYLPDRNSTARMSLATLRLVADRLLEDGLLGAELAVVWHAGEPMVLPPAWYDEACAVLAERLAAHCTLNYSVQTNATRVTDGWCALIKRWNMHVGVSVDGPAVLHDAHRRTRDGKGTHARVIEGMARLRAAGISFHAIAVVTPATLAMPDAFADFFEAEGIHELGCNFDEAEGLHTQSSLAGHEAAHAGFLQHLLERSMRPGSALMVRELVMAQHLVATPLPLYHWHDQRWPDNVQVLPFALLNVAHDGSFSTFSPELLGQPSLQFNNFLFGNVASGGYLAAARSQAFQRAWTDIARGVAACQAQCAHFGYCGGGAPANKLYELADMGGTETLYCRTMLKRPFDAVLGHIEADLAVQRLPVASSAA